ncbi:MAG: GIY-YIG nuclease family protein, partial [Pseudomonadota bacterium]
HRSGAIPGHTKTYMIDRLVWFEPHSTREEAMRRERSIKRWRRAWKDRLIMETNPNWEDVSTDIPL